MKSGTLTAGLLLAVSVAPSWALPLPPRVKAEWDLARAYRESTPTRELVSLNGLWKWQPAEVNSQEVPSSNWGYFKVPGSWPGITDYMQKDSQSVFPHASWEAQRLGSITAAWQEREFTIPANWSGRRIVLQVEYLNSYGTVYMDGKRVGELRFPGGELDITAACQPGGTHRLSLHVVAMPLKGVMVSYTDSAAARQVKGSVARRGICGDVYLVSTPAATRIRHVRVDTSVRRQEIRFTAALAGHSPYAGYRAQATIRESDGTTTEHTSGALAESGGHVVFTKKWKPEKLWDIHTATNQYEVALSLLNENGHVIDTALPVRFGFREFWIEGRDFMLNGSRIFLSSVPLDNAQIGAGLANYAAARESLERLKEIGINFVYTHNYDCRPGSHISFEEILRAAGDVGMLVALSQPHFSDYEWASSGADGTNGYKDHAQFYARVAGNHPSVVAYSMSHNATGYSEDMNPHMIDGVQDGRDNWAQRNAKLALRAEAIVRHIDESRIIYHHASGNLGSLHAINFYPNFVPVQEMSDWFEHWATAGVKTVFTCEYAAPFSWDWTMYRGWHKGKREFGSAKVPWEFCLAEWNAQFFGARAYQISEAEKANLRWEAKQFRAGNLWHRWDYPHQVGSTIFDERYPVFAMYLTDNWRAFRTWGVSAVSPWEHGIFWKLRSGVDKRRREYVTDWQSLQRPGFSPDYTEHRYERLDLAFDRSDWIATPAAEALLRNSQPLLAYIAGKPEHFTSKDHNFVAGERVEKQVIVINNSRVGVTCEIEWDVALPKRVSGKKQITLPTGDQKRIPMHFTVPSDVAKGAYRIKAKVTFDNGSSQDDEFLIHVVAPAKPYKAKSRIALFDPIGETAALLTNLDLRAERVAASDELATFDTLIIGKGALTVDGPAPDISRVQNGLKVIVFEQTARALERRLGFRVQEYGLRQVFPCVTAHPIMRGISEDHLRDWRGEGTILPEKLAYTLRPRHGPTVEWAGIQVPRLWRCGNRGNVASVLIEKPARGDFLSIVDGGYSLQYSPLLEFREGKGLVLFCQLDVTARTERDPVADRIVSSMLDYIENWKPQPRRAALYAGETRGRKHIESCGFDLKPYTGGPIPAGNLLVVGGHAPEAGDLGTTITNFLQSGGKLLAFGLDQKTADTLLPRKLGIVNGEHIAASFEAPGMQSPFAGISPADIHNRDPRQIPLVKSGLQTRQWRAGQVSRRRHRHLPGGALGV